MMVTGSTAAPVWGERTAICGAPQHTTMAKMNAGDSALLRVSTVCLWCDINLEIFYIMNLIGQKVQL